MLIRHTLVMMTGLPLSVMANHNHDLMSVTTLHTSQAPLTPTSSILAVSDVTDDLAQQKSHATPQATSHAAPVPSPHISINPDDGNETWIDDTHGDTKRWLSRTAHRIDDWFGNTDPNKPARASIRVMLDTHHDEYDGTHIKPRIRGKIRLPTLEDRLSILIGDDRLDDEQGGGIYNDTRLIPNETLTFDRRQSTKDNSSLALRWSKFEQNIGVETDADIGIRSSDVYLRLRGEKKWQLPKDNQIKLEQMYRYGTKSEHTALSTLEISMPQSAHRTLINRTHLRYTHQDVENLDFGNSLFQQHHWQAKHGIKTLSYGAYVGGDINDKEPDVNLYGPYVSYRQPVWREWFFVQTDVSYYNDKKENQDHHVSGFLRLEMVF